MQHGSIRKVSKLRSSLVARSVSGIKHLDCAKSGSLDLGGKFAFFDDFVDTVSLLTHHPFSGAWTIHGVCIILLKLLFNCVPGVNQEMSWTLVNITYMFASFLMFHWVRGVPFEFNAGAYDNLNMWEQIDNGDQYTPAKKFLLVFPILVFLLSTHFTHYDLTYFIINFLAVLLVVIPKLPFVSPDSFLCWVASD